MLAVLGDNVGIGTQSILDDSVSVNRVKMLIEPDTLVHRLRMERDERAPDMTWLKEMER